jgi:hypothetical protein
MSISVNQNTAVYIVHLPGTFGRREYTLCAHINAQAFVSVNLSILSTYSGKTKTLLIFLCRIKVVFHLNLHIHADSSVQLE